MERLNRTKLASHPDYDAVIDEVIQNDYDPAIMAEAVKLAKTPSQAEAIYVVLKLQSSL